MPRVPCETWCRRESVPAVGPVDAVRGLLRRPQVRFHRQDGQVGVAAQEGAQADARVAAHQLEQLAPAGAVETGADEAQGAVGGVARGRVAQ
ncbi:hypothetical protein SVIOM342S_01594 [Streptomyces violaceorubidus]